jgi:ArsR family transcriptional regulator
MKLKLIQIKALSDGNRLKMVLALFVHGELCACQITEWLGVTGATVSRHLQQLQQAGLVCAEKEGRWVHFSLSPEFPAELRGWLEPGLYAEEQKRLAAVLIQNPSDLCRKQRNASL